VKSFADPHHDFVTTVVRIQARSFDSIFNATIRWYLRWFWDFCH